jgi:hypothetical protein
MVSLDQERPGEEEREQEEKHDNRQENSYALSFVQSVLLPSLPRLVRHATRNFYHIH